VDVQRAKCRVQAGEWSSPDSGEPLFGDEMGQGGDDASAMSGGHAKATVTAR
jgi:hypothetical protein